MKNTIVLTLLGCLLLLMQAPAQQITVVERSTLQPVADATILVVPSGRTVTTSTTGRAELPAGAAGDSILIQHIAYHPYRTIRSEIMRSGTVRLTERLLNLEEVVVAANKWEQDRRDVPAQILAITPREIAFTNPQTVPDMLANLGGVFVQKSQLGGGSPVLRGFEANRVLLVVDGVRLNNAIYRTGHLQNSVTLDAGEIENAEVIFGPGSTMYGSDALGGVMDFHTKQPRLASDGGMELGAGAFVRHSTANNEKTGHADLNIGFRSFASMTSVTWSDFGDLRAGNVRDPFYSSTWQRTFHVERQNGADVAVPNDKPNLQVGSAYSQLNILERLRWQPSSAFVVDYAFHYSTSSDVPRYDRLTETTAPGVPKYALWNYGPQNWMMHALTLRAGESTPLYDHARVVAAYQRVGEDRINRRFKRNSETHQEERVGVASLGVDLDLAVTKDLRLFYGVEGVTNDVESRAYAVDIVTGARSAAATRYPDGGSTYTTLAAYLSGVWDVSDRTTLSAGARYSHASLNSTFTDTTFYHFPFNDATISTGAITGSVGAVLRPGADWSLAANFSSGFRAPNVDDVGKVFDSSPGTVIVPNPSLAPEYAWSGELSVGRRIGESIDAGVTWFGTLLTDAIVVRNAQFNGQDSIFYQGVMSRVQSAVNTGRAFLTGVSAHLVADIVPDFTLAANVTWTRGRDESNGVPLDHIPPVYGQLRFIHRVDRFKGEFSIMFNGWKYAGEYSPSGEDNIQYATVHGMPAWYTLNLRTSYQVTEQVQLQLGLENILDTHYRVFASGISAPGRNLVATLRAGI